MSTGLRSRNPGWKTFIPFGGLVRIPSESKSHSAMSDSLQPHGLHQNTAVGSPSLLQGMFPTQGSKPGLLHCRQILHQLSHKGSPRILERVAYPFSSGAFWPRNWTGVSCIAGGFFTNWAEGSPIEQLSKWVCVLPKGPVSHYPPPSWAPSSDLEEEHTFWTPTNPIPNTKTHLSYSAHVTIGTCCRKNRTHVDWWSFA